MIASRQREAVQDLAPMLWYSFGAIGALLQEVISVYPAINPPNLTVSFSGLENYYLSFKIIFNLFTCLKKAHQSNRVCNSLALLQCVASHQETRSLFLQGNKEIN